MPASRCQAAAPPPVLSFEHPPILFTDSVSLDGLATQAPRGAAAIFGAPLDRTGSFRPGAAAGPSAVRQMSRSLEAYSPVLDRDLRDLTIFDLGNLSLDGRPMEEALDAIADATERAASLARLSVMIGGEHTVTLGAYRAIKQVYPDAVLVQADAHLDMRDQYEGERITHATWLYHAGDALGFENIVQLGVRSGEREEWPRSRRLTTWSGSELEMPLSVRSRLAGRPIYLTIDIDVLDPSFAPGTGCPEPGGVTFRELAAFLYGLAGLSVVGLDIVEVAPGLDPAGITAVAAAKLIREAVLLFGPES